MIKTFQQFNESKKLDYHFDIPGKKIAYYHINKDKFEYRNKFKIYEYSKDLTSFLRSKDYLILVKNGKVLGYQDADIMINYINNYGVVYVKEKYYKNDIELLSSKLKEVNNKTGVFEN